MTTPATANHTPVICVCGEPIWELTCDACGSARALIEAVRLAEQDEPETPPTFVASQVCASHCHNCFAPTDAADHCEECQAILDWQASAFREYERRRADALERAAHYEIDLTPTDTEPVLVACAQERRVSGVLLRPRGEAEWVADMRPELAWLASLASPALDFYRETQAALRYAYRDVRSLEWKALLSL